MSIMNGQGLILAGDVGGTKTDLALVDRDRGPRHPVAIKRYNSTRYSSLRAIIHEFLQEHALKPEAATIGVAGPVLNNRVEVTNLPWDVDAQQLSQELDGIRVRLLNDLEAIANAIEVLEVQDLVTIKPGVAEPHGAIAIVAPGTGLGEGYLVWGGQRYIPVPSEGGHTDFAPATERELELLSYLMPRLEHVSYERVCSGMGMPNLYEFFRDVKQLQEPDWLRRAIEQADDMTPIIVTAAKEGSTEICVATLDLFISILGSEAGNLVLQAMATGGVYLAGGIPPNIIDQLLGDTFLTAFMRKGRLSDVLDHVPVQIIVNRRAGLFGAANHSLLMLDDGLIQDR